MRKVCIYMYVYNNDDDNININNNINNNTKQYISHLRKVYIISKSAKTKVKKKKVVEDLHRAL